MKIFLLLMSLLLCVTSALSGAVLAAAPTAKQAPAAGVAPEASQTPAGAAVDKAQTMGKGAADNEYVCPYYKVTLPEGWKAVMPPHDQQGNISAIFATSTNGTVVTMIIGPNDGADAQTIASMFAEQFKATGKPVEKNGQYTFRFQMQNGAAQAWVGTQGAVFMVTAVSGNTRQGQDFLRRAVSSEQWGDLLPK